MRTSARVHRTREIAGNVALALSKNISDRKRRVRRAPYLLDQRGHRLSSRQLLPVRNNGPPKVGARGTCVNFTDVDNMS